MPNRRFFWLLAVLALVAASAVACGGDDGGGDSDVTVADTPTATFTPVAEGKMTVCTDAPFPPFEFEGDDGVLTGFDIELMRAISANLGLELEPTLEPFDGIWLAPEAGTCDIVASAVTITPTRAEAALFSDPYFDLDQSLLVRTDQAGELSDIDALAGKTIGVESGTTGEEYANGNAPAGATVRAFDLGDELFTALESGEIDAVLQDFPANLDRANKDGAVTVTGPIKTGEQYGFATSKANTDLMDAVNGELAQLRGDGTYETIFDAWFPSA